VKIAAGYMYGNGILESHKIPEEFQTGIAADKE
jgi:hypothetical protein